MTIQPLGDRALTIMLGTEVHEATLHRVRLFTHILNERKPSTIVDIVPAYTTVTVVCEGGAALLADESPIESARNLIQQCWTQVQSQMENPDLPLFSVPRVFKIPVCYGGRFGPDLADVARHAGITAEDVIAQHAGARYDVCAVGFAPGFPYLRGLPPTLYTPRHATPRTMVAAGSVGIGGSQTGIYPLSTPGGWQLIGRTPVPLFDVTRPHPSLLRVGDRVTFTVMTEEEFSTWKSP